MWRISTPPLDNPPSTVPFQQTPYGDEKGTPYRLNNTYNSHIKVISPNDGYQWMMKPNNMVINDPYSSGEQPLCQYIGCGGNYFAFDEETATHVRLVSWNWYKTPVLLSAIHNWMDMPWKIWKACTIREDGKISNVGGGFDAYWMLIGKPEMWLNKKYAELFPPGLNYKFRGMDIWDGDVPLLTVDKYGQRYFPTRWHFDTLGVIPPKGWKA